MKTHWKYFSAALAIGWFLGAACGLGLAQWSPMRAGKSPERMAERFSRKLQLTPQQETQLKTILSEKRGKMTRLRAEFDPRMDDIRTAARAEIRALLTPEQQARFDQLEAKKKKRWKRYSGWREGAGSGRRDPQS